IRLAQDGRIRRILRLHPNPVTAKAAKRKRQLADVLSDAIQARIQGRVAGQVAALQLVVLLPRARVWFMDDAPATTPVVDRLHGLLATGCIMQRAENRYLSHSPSAPW